MSPALSEPSLPKYLDLCRMVEEQIESGELQPGDRLPSFVQMREQFGVTTATVERILRTLENKGLVRREPSRGTFVTARARACGVIGILTQSAFRQHPYYSVLLNSAQDAAHELGAEVLLLLENSVVSRNKVDGVLSIGGVENLIRQLPLAMPRVSLMGVQPGMSSVVADDAQGTASAVDYLVELGHRRIAFLTVGHLRYADAASRLRYRAYEDALQRHGITLQPKWVKALRDDYDNKPFQGFAVAARSKMQEWLDQDWIDLDCTALLVQNDEAAIQVIQVLQENGYRVPEQVSVVGFDDTALCTIVSPHLTTVNVGLEQIGARAVQLLLEKVATPSSPDNGHAETTVTLPTKLIVRDSTAPAPLQIADKNILPREKP